jgi:hypothetical protein
VRVHLRRRQVLLIHDIDWMLVDSVLEDKLLELAEVRHVSLFVNTTGIVACAAHLPASASDQNHFHAIERALVVNIPLYQCDTPVLGNLLRSEVLAEIIIPHVPGVTGILAADVVKRFVDADSGCSLLGIGRQVKIVSKVKAAAKILLYLLLDVQNE